MTSGYRDYYAIGVWFLGEEFTYKFTERDFFSPFEWNVFAYDNKEGVEACQSLFLGAVFAFYYALAQTSNLVCVWLLPHLFASWVVSQLDPLEDISPFLIQDRHGPVQYKLKCIAAAGCWSSSDCCGEALSGSSPDCNWFGSMDYGCVLSLGECAVGNRYAHPWIWVSRDFWTDEIVLASFYVAGWGVGSWGHPWILMMPLCSGIFSTVGSWGGRVTSGRVTLGMSKASGEGVVLVSRQA